MNKAVTIIVSLLALLIVGFYALNTYIYKEKQGDPNPPDRPNMPSSEISSYEDCVDAGYSTIPDSYPEQCVDGESRRFIRRLPDDEIASVTTEMVIEGRITCLPHWNTDGPQTLECAFGLIDYGGYHYVLRDTSPNYENISSASANSRVLVTGRFIPGSDEKYRSVGTIEILEIETLDEDEGMIIR